MGIYLVIAGIIMFVCVSLALAMTEWKIIIVFGYAITIFLIGTGREFVGAEVEIGKPKTSIEAGSYGVVEHVEWVAKDGQSYYYMILMQKSGVKFYSLPKDMIDIVQSEKGGTLEVVEKSGLRKAILYLPIPDGVNPSP